MQQSVEQCQCSSSSSTPVMWPSIGGMPLNEFPTEGYFSCAFPTLFPTGAADFRGECQVPVTIANYFKHPMQYDDGRFARHPRLRCNIVVSRQAESMSGNTQEMANYPWMSCGTWLGDKERPSPVEYSTMPPVYVAQNSIGNVSGVVCSSWWTHWVSLPSSSHTVLQTFNGQSLLNSSVLIAQTPGLPEPRQSFRTQPLQTGSTTRVCEGWTPWRTDYWLRFEWQHRGSLHVHGLAWLPGTPRVEDLTDDASETLQDDQLVSTMNPAALPDGSNIADAPVPKVNPHVCNKAYRDIEDINCDLINPVATCQAHTRCSASYCLRTKHGKQECCFGYPKPLQSHTAIVTDNEPTLLTARNDGMINSLNPVQLSAWCANVDMQHIVSRQNNSPYSKHHVTSSSSALMGLVLLRTTWRRDSVLQHCPLLTTTLDILTPLTSTP